MMTNQDLTDIFSLFIYGLPIGALLTSICWAVGFAIDALIKFIRSTS